MKINNINIVTKLGVSFSTIVLVAVAMFFFSIYELKKETKMMHQTFNTQYNITLALNDISMTVMASDALIESAVHQKNILDVNNFVNTITLYNLNINDKFKSVSKQYLGSKDEFNKVFNLFQEHTFMQETLIKLLKEKNFEKAGDEYHSTYKAKVLYEKIQALSNNTTNVFETSDKEITQTITVLSFMSGFFILLSLVIALMTIRGILKPLNSLMYITKKINDGKVSLEDNEEMFNFKNRNDEIGLLFNEYIELIGNVLLPYGDIIKSNRPLIEKTDEIRRLLNSFDKHVIASKTDENGNIIYVSEAFVDISGYTKDELIGHNQNIVSHPDVSKEKFEDLWKTILSGKTWNGEILNRTKNGGFFWLRSSISPDISKEGLRIGFNAISENITDAKAYEELSNTLELRVKEEIEKNNLKTTFMLQQSRLAQMGEMISMIAHQWRQPLASISAISGTLTLDIMMDKYDADFFEERLASINELSQHLSSTIDDFRGFFKEDKLKTNFTLKDNINSSLDIINAVLENKGINIEKNIEEGVTVNSFSNEIKQVLLNIFKNAEDVLLDKEIQNATISIYGYKKDNYAYIDIEDNAGGIAEDIMQKIFNPYFSTKIQKDGTGLGLYLSKVIIEDHCDGKLMVKNTSKGACFTIKLPLELKELP
jgi:PAS domain S-box-containing protein